MTGSKSQSQPQAEKMDQFREYRLLVDEALASAIVFRTCSGRTKGSSWAATHAGPITWTVDAISCRLLERGGPVSRGSSTGLLSAPGITPTPMAGSSRGGLLECDLGILSAHCGGEHTAEIWWPLSELESITSSYCSLYPLWHTGDGLPGLGPRGKGLKHL